LKPGSWQLVFQIIDRKKARDRPGAQLELEKSPTKKLGKWAKLDLKGCFVVRRILLRRSLEKASYLFETDRAISQTPKA